MPARLRHFLAASVCWALLDAIPVHAADWQYLTVPGDTLIGIGQQYLKNPNDWPKVQAENRVEIPRKMPTNFRLRIPVALLKVTPAPVEVTAVNGNVRYKAVAGGYQALKPGDRLNGGETVLTGPRSSASFRFADGTTLTQQASAKLSFGRLAAYGKTGMIATELNLESGRLEASAARQVAPAGGFQVRTPVAVAGLRGTAFRVGVAEDGRRMTSEVTEGSVAVAAQGQSVPVDTGFGTYTEAGAPPAPARPLLPAPDLTALPAKVLRLPLQFAWPGQEGARAWRVRIGSGEGFDTVLLDDVTATPGIQWSEDLADGDYVLRARAVDEAGLEGRESAHPFTLDARPLPPVPIAPALGARLYQPEARLEWSAVADARGYVLQLAPTPEFAQGLVERRLEAVVGHQETLDEGEWHWRVASLDAAGQAHVFSPHRAFVVKPLPSPPGGGQSQVGNGQARFTWEPSRGADSYGIEVAKATDRAVVARQDAREPQAALALDPGKYVWRVRGQEADGQAGAWGGENLVILPPAPPRDLKVDTQAHPMTLSWQGQAPRYRVELAADAEFARPLTILEVGQPRAQLPLLQPGTYHARVIALGAEGVPSGPSAVAAFTVEWPKPWWLLLLPALAL